MSRKKKAPEPNAPVEVVVQQKLSVLPIKPTSKVSTKNFAVLRLEAMAVYLMDMHGCTIEDVHKDDRFKEIPLATMRSWAQVDDWAGKRKLSYVALQNRLTAETSKMLTDRLYHEVQSLMTLEKKADTLLINTEPRSWEGVAKIKMEIHARLADIAKLVGDGVVDEMGHSVEQQKKTNTVPMPKIKYDAAKVREAARLYTRGERDNLRARLKELEPPKEGVEDAAGKESVAEPKGPTPGPTPKPDSSSGPVPIPEIVSPRVGGHSGGNKST